MKLLEPIAIKGVRLKNRIVYPSVILFDSKANGAVDDDRLTHYTRIAESGVGLIVCEASAVLPEGRASGAQIRLWDDALLDGLKRLSDEVHKRGVPIFMQPHHAGFKVNREFGVPFGPSAIADGIHEATVDELKRVRDAFIAAARRAEAAGMDGVEIHGAHGYLLNTMADPTTNLRTDEYGGDIEGRLRLAYEIIDGIKQTCNRDFVVGYRLGANSPTWEDGAVIAAKLEARGLDYISSSYGHVKLSNDRQPVSENFNYNEVVWGASLVKAKVSIPVIAVNRIETGERAEWLIEHDCCDLCAFARPILATPDFAKNIREGVVPASKCFGCMPCKWHSDRTACPARNAK